jgi:hypothetical protein
MRTLVIGSLIVGAWLALLPPFFTHGACSAEFDAASSELERQRSELGTLDQAEAYLRSHGIPHQILTAERCESAPPREVESCPGGPTLLASIPFATIACGCNSGSTAVCSW